MVVNQLDSARRAAKTLGGLPLIVKPTYSTQKAKRCETRDQFERTVRSALRRSPQGQAWIETVAAR